jgi:hypothetical protein
VVGAGVFSLSLSLSLIFHATGPAPEQTDRQTDREETDREARDTDLFLRLAYLNESERARACETERDTQRDTQREERLIFFPCDWAAV